MNKILKGLKEALRHAQCDHNWSDWKPKGDTYQRHCCRCDCTEHRLHAQPAEPRGYKGTAPHYKLDHSPRGTFITPR